MGRGHLWLAWPWFEARQATLDRSLKGAAIAFSGLLSGLAGWLVCGWLVTLCLSTYVGQCDLFFLHHLIWPRHHLALGRSANSCKTGVEESNNPGGWLVVVGIGRLIDWLIAWPLIAKSIKTSQDEVDFFRSIFFSIHLLSVCTQGIALSGEGGVVVVIWL